MKLLVFSPYYPPHRGGLETHSDEFNKHLSQEGVAITVFTPRLPTTSPVRETLHTDVHVIRYPACEIIHNYPVPAFWKKEFWTLWRELRQNSYSLVLSRTRFFFPSLMAGWYAWRKNVLWVHVEHGSDFAQFEGKIKSSLAKIYDATLGALVLRKAGVLVANSKASQGFVEYLSKRADCQLIYRGVEKELIVNAAPQTSFRLEQGDNLLVGYIGRLIEGKGMKDLIHAFHKVQQPHWRLIIIGDGPEEDRLKELAKELSIENQVLFLGALPLALAMGYLKVFDIFVNPSYTEGIPTSIIEAALLKKAVIATRVGGTEEIITGKGDGLLVSERRPDELAEALRVLGADASLRAQYGANAYKQVSEKFLWQKAIESYQTLFKNALS